MRWTNFCGTGGKPAPINMTVAFSAVVGGSAGGLSFGASSFCSPIKFRCSSVVGSGTFPKAACMVLCS